MERTERINQDLQAPQASELAGLLDAQVTAGEGSLEQKTWRLSRPVTLIGCSGHAHIRVEDEGVAAVHAALLNTGDAIVLADLVSRGGVYCGSEKVQRRVMYPGEAFSLGNCLLQLDIEAAPTMPVAQRLRLPEPVHIQMIRGGMQEWTIEAIGAVIGSRPGCDVRLLSREVLPLQAVLTRVGLDVVLASLAADKLIRVNDAAVNRAMVRSGDTFTVWPIVMRMTVG